MAFPEYPLFAAAVADNRFWIALAIAILAGVNAVGAAFFIPTTTASHFSGWTAGGGLEYLLSAAWSLKLEYQHFGFGNETSATTINSQCCTYTHKVSFDTAQIGLNYHLGH